MLAERSWLKTSVATAEEGSRSLVTLTCDLSFSLSCNNIRQVYSTLIHPCLWELVIIQIYYLDEQNHWSQESPASLGPLVLIVIGEPQALWTTTSNDMKRSMILDIWPMMKESVKVTRPSVTLDFDLSTLICWSIGKFMYLKLIYTVALLTSGWLWTEMDGVASVRERLQWERGFSEWQASVRERLQWERGFSDGEASVRKTLLTVDMTLKNNECLEVTPCQVECIANGTLSLNMNE